MFEKEAEEYTKKNFCGCCPLTWKNQCKNFINCGYHDSWKEGAEFGYNKANEWHKPSEKLPEECSLVLAYLFEETEPTICKYVVSDQWECLPKRIVFCSNDQVRKWQEIVLPELPKE